MAKRKSIFERMAMKQKVSMVKKNQAMQTLREELDRTNALRDQLSDIAEETAIKSGPTTAMHIRSANWYAGQIQEQLVTMSNRSEFLVTEVSAQQAVMAEERYRHKRSLEKHDEYCRQQRAAAEDRQAALMPPIMKPKA